jgi:hypothetical protein
VAIIAETCRSSAWAKNCPQFSLTIMKNTMDSFTDFQYDKRSKLSSLAVVAFYFLKPLIPRRFQLGFRRFLASRKRKSNCATWPIDPRAGVAPRQWGGWPDGKQFALVLMHDVDTQRGYDKCHCLMDLEEKLGVRSAFNLVPEKRYRISGEVLEEIKQRKFGLGVHGLNHNGTLFLTYRIFCKQAAKINDYLAAWGTTGFSSPSMHHRLEWMHHLNINHGTSTFDTDPFEPQPDAVRTIFPFIVKNAAAKAFVELPYTLPQDFSLFIILQEKTIDVWKKKLDWIAGCGGMALLNVHPDYINFNENAKNRREEYPVRLYSEFLAYVKTAYAGRFWNALPEEISQFINESKVQ